MRILIAEDDAKLLKSLVHIFELNHYIVDGVNNGTDAYDYAVMGEYDGLVLDIMMAGMDGVTVLKKLRQNTTEENFVVFCFLSCLSHIRNYDDETKEVYFWSLTFISFPKALTKCATCCII